MAPNSIFMDFDLGKMLNTSKMMADLKFNGVDMDALLALQRRNIEAWTAANQAAFEGMQALGQRQAEMMRQSLEEAARVAKEMFAAGSPEEKAARQAELAKEAYERAVANARELADLASRSQEAALGVLNKRVAESLDEVKSYITTRASKDRRAAA
jgi:phasin family protein